MRTPLTDNITDESEGREDPIARTGLDDTAKGTATSSLPHDGSNMHRDSHTTSDAQPSSSEHASSTPHDEEQQNLTTSASRADVDNDGSSPFDDQTSFGKDHLLDDDSQRDRDAFSDTTGRGPGLRDDTPYVGRDSVITSSYAQTLFLQRGGSSQDQDTSSTLNSSTLNRPTEDMDNTTYNQNEDNQTGRDTASDTIGHDLSSRKEDTSTTSHGRTSGADQLLTL